MTKIKYRVPGPGYIPVHPEDVMPPFKLGDIVKFRDIDGSLFIGVITLVDKSRDRIHLTPADWKATFFDKVGERLKAGEADYDYSDRSFDTIPFKVTKANPYHY